MGFFLLTKYSDTSPTALGMNKYISLKQCGIVFIYFLDLLSVKIILDKEPV